jgi:hypothetical protein
MNHFEIIDVLHYLTPDSTWTLDNETLTWLDSNQTQPTAAEMQAALPSALEAKAQKLAAIEAKRQAVLDKLGLTADEAKLLLA